MYVSNNDWKLKKNGTIWKGMFNDDILFRRPIPSHHTFITSGGSNPVFAPKYNTFIAVSERR